MCAVRAGVEFEYGQLDWIPLDAVPNFLDGRGHDRRGVVGVAEFEVHAAADVLQLEHGASPGGTGDGNLNRLRAEFRMAGEKRLAASQQDCGVAVIHGLNLQDSGRRKIVEVNATFYFRLDDAAINFVGQIGMSIKHADDRE